MFYLRALTRLAEGTGPADDIFLREGRVSTKVLKKFLRSVSANAEEGTLEAAL